MKANDFRNTRENTGIVGEGKRIASSRGRTFTAYFDIHFLTFSADGNIGQRMDALPVYRCAKHERWRPRQGRLPECLGCRANELVAQPISSDREFPCE